MALHAQVSCPRGGKRYFIGRQFELGVSGLTCCKFCMLIRLSGSKDIELWCEDPAEMLKHHLHEEYDAGLFKLVAREMQVKQKECRAMITLSVR